jgi:nicotinamidase-related amidase
MAIWDDVLTGMDREVYEQFRGTKELGKRPALVVVDVNYAFTGLQSEPILDSIKTFRTSCGEYAWQAIPRLQALIAAARQAGVPVVYSTGIDREVRGAGWANRARQPGTLERLDEADFEKRKLGNTIVKEIEPQPGDTVIRKVGPSVFFGTPLTTLLNELDVDTLIVTGTTTSGCVRATAVDAAQYNFRAVVPEECVWDRGELTHKVNLFDIHMKYGDVRTTDEVIEYLRGLPQRPCGERTPTGLPNSEPAEVQA